MSEDQEPDQDQQEQQDDQDDQDQQLSEEELAEIEEERKRRLDPENRPENAEVDNTDAELPTVEEFNSRDAEDRSEEGQGTADPAQKFRDIQPSEEEIAQIEEERKRRLAPENRPENAEVDNTGDKMPDIAKDDQPPEE